VAIIANLMVADMARALGFWRDLLGFEVKLAVTAERAVTTDGTADNAVFVTLAWQGVELMLQEARSLRDELPGVLAADGAPPKATILLKGYDHRTVAAALPAGLVVKGPIEQWYGMTELYLRDPDGHIVGLTVPTPAASG